MLWMNRFHRYVSVYPSLFELFRCDFMPLFNMFNLVIRPKYLCHAIALAQMVTHMLPLSIHVTPVDSNYVLFLGENKSL